MRASLVLKLACLAAFLFAVALVQVVKSIDVERYRGVLESLSRQATGQALEVRGKISLRLSLSPGIEANDVVLPAPAGAAEPYQASIGHLEADVALLPLLAGEVRVQKVSAFGVRVLLERTESGGSNWPIQRIAQTTISPVGTPVTKVEITQVEMADVTLRLVDHARSVDQEVHFDQLAGEVAQPSRQIAVTARGSWGGRAFDASGMVGGTRELVDPAKPFPITLKAVWPGLVTTVHGTMERGTSGVPTANLSVTANVIDMGETGRLFGLSLPPLGAARGSFTLLGALDRPSVSALDLVFGRRDTLAFSVKGNIADPLAQKGVDVAITVEGDSLPAFGKNFDLVLPSLGSIRLSTHLTDTQDGWRFTEIRGGSRRNDVAGHLFLHHMRDGFGFEAEFESTNIDVGELWGTAVADASADGLPDGRVFSDRLLPLGLLAMTDGSLMWDIHHLVIGGLEVDDVHLPMTLRGGRLNASLTVGKIAGGRATAAMVLESTQSPALVTLNVATDKVEAGPIFAAFGGASGLDGAPTDLQLTLSASGDNVRAIFSKLAGEGSLAVGEGSFAGGLSIEEAPWLKESRIGLVCGYSHFTVEDGLAVTDNIVFDLTPATVGGRGSINLGREELDLVFIPRLKDQNVPAISMDVSGTLRHPSLLPSRGAAVKGVVPILPSLPAGGNAVNICQAAVMARKPPSVHHRPGPSVGTPPSAGVVN